VSTYFIDDKEYECGLNGDNETPMQQSKRLYNGSTAAMENDGGHNFIHNNNTTFAGFKESQNQDNLIADKRELPKSKNDNDKVAENVCRSLCLVTTCPKTDDVTTSRASGIHR
jgi:hypothetical protein